MQFKVPFLSLSKKQNALWGLLVVALVMPLGLWFLQAGIARHQTLPLFGVYTLLFVAYLWLLTNRQHFTLVTILGLSVVARLVLFFDLPSLSDDFYRFLWDGHLHLRGYHPFAEVPSYYWANSNLLTDPYLYQLFGQMNSPEYFTIYPPICQGIFALAAWLGGANLLASVNVIRSVYLLTEILAWFQVLRLLTWFKVGKKHIGWLILNPLFMLEGLGNLHPEFMLLPFMLLIVEGLMLINTRYLRAIFTLIIGFAGAVAVKLWPLLFGPYILFKLGWTKGLLWILGSIFLLAMLCWPLLSPVLAEGYTESLGLYFQQFEFNASLYYIIRWLGTLLVGYNPIAIVAPALSVITGVGVLFVSWWAAKKNWPVANGLFCLYGIFLLGSAVVHPWYILPLLMLTPFLAWRGAILWSVLIFLTYAGYTIAGFQESLVLVAVEYGLLLLYFLFVDKNLTPNPARRYLLQGKSNYGKNILQPRRFGKIWQSRRI